MRPAHTLVVFSGLIGAPDEAWSYGLRFHTDPAADTIAEFQTLAEECVLPWTDNMAAVTPSNAALTLVKASKIGSDGHVMTDSEGGYIQGIWTGLEPGAMTGDQHPLQTSLAVGLRTGRSGPTGKGRIFLPYYRATLQTDGRISATQQGNANTAVAGLINDLNALTNLGTCVVASSKGYLSDVVGVRTGLVVDTLRTRRKDQLEEYVNLDL